MFSRIDNANPLYTCWLLVGPNCPPLRPSHGKSSLITLPAIIAQHANESKSYWWLEDHVETHRNVLVLWNAVSPEELGTAYSIDNGDELNLRSFNASKANRTVHAYLLQGDTEPHERFGISGTYSSFHIVASRYDEDDSNDGIQGVMVNQLQDKNILSLHRCGSVPATEERFAFMVDRMPANRSRDRLVLLPGVARLECNSNHLRDLLDVFLATNTPNALTAPVSDDPRDFLFTAPSLAHADASIPFFDPAWEDLRHCLILRPASNAKSIEDWPPLLRLCLACWQPGIRETCMEGGKISIHPFDVSAQTLLKQPASSSAEKYRDWLFFDAAVTEEPDGWKEKVVQVERRNFFDHLQRSGDWQRIWRHDSTDTMADSGNSNEGPGYKGEIQRRPPNNNEDLNCWIGWIESMPLKNQRWGYRTLLDLLNVIVRRVNESKTNPGSLHPLLKLLRQCVSIGTEEGCHCFNHELAVRKLAECLMAPAVYELKNLNFSDRSRWELPGIYFLLEFLVCQNADQDSQQTDWLVKPSPLWTDLTLAIPTLKSQPFGTKECLILPCCETDAALTRLLMPPCRIRTAGFRLGESRLGHPAHPL